MHQSVVHLAVLRRPFAAVDSASSLLSSTVEREAAPAGRPSASCGSKEVAGSNPASPTTFC